MRQVELNQLIVKTAQHSEVGGIRQIERRKLIVAAIERLQFGVCRQIQRTQSATTDIQRGLRGLNSALERRYRLNHRRSSDPKNHSTPLLLSP